MLSFLYTLESLRVWFNVGKYSVVAYTKVVTLMGLAVGYFTVVIPTTIGGWLPYSGSFNYNRVLATLYYSVCNAMVTGT